MAARGKTWAAALLAAVTLVACGGSSEKRATPPAPPDPPATIEIATGQRIKMGVSAPLTDYEGGLGADLADAVELAVRDHGATVKGTPMQVVRMDDGCGDPEKAASAARSLTGDAAVAGVIGPMCTTGAQAGDSIYDAAHMIHILPAATRVDLSEQGESYFFRTAWLDDAQAATQAQYLLGTAHAATTVLIDDTEPYGKTLADAFAKAYAAGGGTVASRERIAPGDTDFDALVRKVRSVNPDAVVFEGLNPGAALVLQALRKDGYGGWFVAPDAALNARDFIEPLRDAATGASLAEGAILTGGPTPDAAFVAKFVDAFQHEPSTPFVLQAYDAATALLGAIGEVATETNGTLVIDRAGLKDALRARELNGLTGAIRFNERGDRGGTTPRDVGLVVYKVVDGRFQAQ